MKAIKVGTILWSLGLSIAAIVLIGSVLLPSTKRARIDWEEVRKERESEQAREATEQQAAIAATAPATLPTTMP